MLEHIPLLLALLFTNLPDTVAGLSTFDFATTLFIVVVGSLAVGGFCPSP